MSDYVNHLPTLARVVATGPRYNYEEVHSEAIVWAESKNSRVSLVLVDEQGAYERLNDQRRDNELEIRDVRLAYRLANCYDDAVRWIMGKMLDGRVDFAVRRAMIESFGMGYATLRDCLAYEHGVNYFLACIVAFRLRSISDGSRSWL